MNALTAFHSNGLVLIIAHSARLQFYDRTAGDVIIELPGKIGFMQVPADMWGPNGTASMTQAQREQYGIGTDSVLPIAQIVALSRSLLDEIPPERVTRRAATSRRPGP